MYSMLFSSDARLNGIDFFYNGKIYTNCNIILLFNKTFPSLNHNIPSILFCNPQFVQLYIFYSKCIIYYFKNKNDDDERQKKRKK